MTSKPVNSAVRFAAVISIVCLPRYRGNPFVLTGTSSSRLIRSSGLAPEIDPHLSTWIEIDDPPRGASCRRTPVIVNEDGSCGRNSTTGDQHQQTALIVHCVVGAFRIYGAAS